MSEKMVLYSIQRTYTLTRVLTPEREIVTCNQRIDIPTIEPLTQMETLMFQGTSFTVVPCIELAGAFLSEFDLTFETNEGVTVLPVKIYPLDQEFVHPFENPYTHIRYVLVLPRGATGVKSCKLIPKATGIEVQHNFTFGIMPPPYNYDNALLGVISTFTAEIIPELSKVKQDLGTLKLTTITPTFVPIELSKGEGKKTINIEPYELFFETLFSYPTSPEPTTHKPKIILHGEDRDFVYTLSLNRTINGVSIDLFTGILTVYDGVTGEIIQQFRLYAPYRGFKTLSFENFDDIDTSSLSVLPKGARVE